ncbi:MAG: ABC transporter ATP-binding protein [Spirochaetota bacterium]|nr:ABC transporter ATP-binding protein [Spirochaetota bacterium]
MSPVPLLEARKIGFRYGRHSCLFQGLDVTLHEGEFLAVLGPSGCGKTSLLKILGGFLVPGSGSVFRQGQPVQSPSPDAVMVFQEFDQLFPWKRVWSNVAFPLKAGGGRTGRRMTGGKKAGGGKADRRMTGVRKAGERNSVPEVPAARRGLDRSRDIDRRVENILREVGLYEFRQYFPYQLSGGMKQRIALARSLVSRPPILLMDEPFGSLDAQKREELQGLLLRMWDEHGFSVVFVTHDISEALILADRIMVMRLPEEKAGGGGEPPVSGKPGKPGKQDRPGELGMSSEQSGPGEPGMAGAAGTDPCSEKVPVQSLILDIDLPRPRSPQDPGFMEYYRRIFSLLGTESKGNQGHPQ